MYKYELANRLILHLNFLYMQFFLYFKRTKNFHNYNCKQKYQKINMTAVRRILKELQDINKAPTEGVSCGPLNADDPFKWQATI